MKNIIKTCLMLILVSTGFATEFSVQGVLRDPLGRTVDDGQYSVTFKIYDVASSGSALWTEVHGSVDIQHGIFTELLGGTTSMEDLAFNTTYWIGISVEEGVEMSPRTQLTTSPYSKSVFGTDNVFPSVGRIGVGTLEPDAAFHVINKNNETDILLINDANDTEQVKVANDGTLSVPDGIFGNGELGVGTQEPDARMHIVGADGDNLLITDSDGNAQVKVANDGTLTVPDGIFGNGVLGVGTQNPTAALHILSNDDDDKLRIDDENNSPQVQVNSDGYLGINNPTLDGVAVIGAPLSVSGNLRLYNDGVLLFTDGTQLASADFGGSATGVTSPSTATINALSSDGNIALNVGSADKVVVTSVLTDIKTSLKVSNPTTLENTLTVSGATSINSTLSVTGLTNLSGGLSVSGDVALGDASSDATTVNGILKANGAYAGFGTVYTNVALNVRNSNDLEFAFLVEDSDGNTDFEVMLDGTVSAKRDFEVHDSTTLGGTLDVIGASTLGGTLDVTGLTTLEGVLSANGAYAGFGQAYTDVALNIKNVESHGKSFLVEDADGNNDFWIHNDGTVSAKRDFEVDGVTTLEGVLNANGAYAGFGQAYSNVALNVKNVNDHAFAFLVEDSDGNTDFQVNLDGTVIAKRNFEVEGATNLAGTTVAGALGVVGAATIIGNTSVIGNTTIVGALNVNKSYTDVTQTLKNNNRTYTFYVIDTDENRDFSVHGDGTVAQSQGGGVDFPNILRGSIDEPLNSLENIMQLTVNRYDDRHYQFGLLNEEVSELFPDLIRDYKTPVDSLGRGNDPFQVVNMTGISMIMLQAIKELKREKDKEVQAIKEDYDRKLVSILARIEELENQ